MGGRGATLFELLGMGIMPLFLLIQTSGMLSVDPEDEKSTESGLNFAGLFISSSSSSTEMNKPGGGGGI